jgi:cytochrome P450
MTTTPRRPANVRLDNLARSELIPLFAASMDPEHVYPALREEWGSVAAVELDGGIPAWLVLDWDDALRVMREPYNFSRDVTHWAAFQNGHIAPNTGLYAFFMPRDNAYYTDGRTHERLRQVVDDAFDMVDEHALAEQVREFCDRMLALIVRDGATSTDLVPNYTAFVPSLAVAAMYGLDAEEAMQLGRFAKDIFSNTPAAGPAFVGINQMLGYLIHQRKERPGNDVLSAIVHWIDPKTGYGLTDKEMLDTAQMIQSAGHEMAVAWTTTSLVHLLADGNFGGRVRGGRLGVDEALDSVLVNASPTGNTPARFVIRDTVIGGRMVHAGDAISAAVGRATADAHRDGDRIWESTSRASLAWGTGPHRCPAERISRIIVKAAVEAVMIRLPGLRLSVPASELGVGVSLWSIRADRLPVEFDAVRDYDTNWRNLVPAWQR